VPINYPQVDILKEVRIKALEPFQGFTMSKELQVSSIVAEGEQQVPS
jgi:hypothetical protein